MDITQKIALAALIVALSHLLLSTLVAFYSEARGYPWFPIFISALSLSPVIVLFIVVIAAGRRQPEPQPYPLTGHTA